MVSHSNKTNDFYVQSSIFVLFHCNDVFSMFFGLILEGNPSNSSDTIHKCWSSLHYWPLDEPGLLGLDPAGQELLPPPLRLPDGGEEEDVEDDQGHARHEVDADHAEPFIENFTPNLSKIDNFFSYFWQVDGWTRLHFGFFGKFKFYSRLDLLWSKGICTMFLLTNKSSWSR